MTLRFVASRGFDAWLKVSILRMCFRKLGERMAQGNTADKWEDSVIDLLDSGKRPMRISTRLVEGKVVVLTFEPSDELLRHL